MSSPPSRFINVALRVSSFPSKSILPLVSLAAERCNLNLLLVEVISVVFSGCNPVVKYLTKEELEGLTKDHADKLVDIFNKLDDAGVVKDMPYMAMAGIVKKGWYKGSAGRPFGSLCSRFL